MKKLLFLLTIALTAPAIADADRIKTFEDRVAAFEKKEAQQKEDEKIFIEHRNAMIKNSTLIIACAAVGCVGGMLWFANKLIP